MSENNIVSLVPSKKEESKGYIKLTYTTGNYIIMQADSFGPFENLPGFIIFWRETPEEVVGLYNASCVRDIVILKEGDADNYSYIKSDT